MPKYLVLLQGENFPIRHEGKTRLCGFYCNRKVKAQNAEQAKAMAIAAVNSDAYLSAVIDPTMESLPKVSVAEIKAIPWWSRLNAKGFSFYPEEK